MSHRGGAIERLETGVRNLDGLLGGGLPKGSALLLCGPPGSGKTILSQQICFHNASPTTPVLYFSTLSEPTAKILRYLRQFSFVDEAKLEKSVRFVDLGEIMRAQGLERATTLIMDHVKATKPALIVIDSFKVFDDLARSKEELRKFGYEVLVKLLAWECTTLLLGEYAAHDYETSPVFSIVDGLITVSQRELSGEQQRFLQIVKMRGVAHDREEHSFTITPRGVELFTPRSTIRREPIADTREGPAPRVVTGISNLDDLLGSGIPRGSSLLIGGVAGTGKTVLLLEFVYRGALAGEKGIVFSFEETEERLRATARGLGWDLDRQIKRGMVEIIFIPQPDIMVESNLLMVRERIEKLGARRVAFDSASVFLHKIKDAELVREKVFQLASLIQNAQAVGFFATDIPYGSGRISRFGVEETVVDGVILLTATEEGLERPRYLEIYKLRNTAHLKGRHSMVIATGGITVFPRYEDDPAGDPPPSVASKRRISSGIPALDVLLCGGMLERSVTLVSGSAGIGKTTFGVQFAVGGTRPRHKALYVSLEEGPDQILNSADALALPLRRAVKAKTVEILFLSGQGLRPAPFLATVLEKVRASGAKRLVLDGASHFEKHGFTPNDLRALLHGLITQLKRHGVTTLLTLESKGLFTKEFVTDRELSPVSDNLLMLRYIERAGELVHTLTVVKTRGSDHDRRTHEFTIGRGGLRIAPGDTAPGKRTRRRKKT